MCWRHFWIRLRINHFLAHFFPINWIPIDHFFQSSWNFIWIKLNRIYWGVYVKAFQSDWAAKQITRLHANMANVCVLKLSSLTGLTSQQAALFEESLTSVEQTALIRSSHWPRVFSSTSVTTARYICTFAKPLPVSAVFRSAGICQAFLTLLRAEN